VHTLTVFTKRLIAKSSARKQLIDLTSEVSRIVRDAGVKEGMCMVSVPHATAAVLANEHETGLMRDMLARIDALFPESGAYEHNAIDDNADAHIAAAFLGHSRSFPVSNGELVRGTWQNIFLVELDGPRSRREVVVQVIGDN
jgi:secondary thiamine-phosphate synthase enzyme